MTAKKFKENVCVFCGSEDMFGALMGPLAFVHGPTEHLYPHESLRICAACWQQTDQLKWSEFSNFSSEVKDWMWDLLPKMACDWCANNKNARPWTFEGVESLVKWEHNRETNCTCQVWDVYDAFLDVMWEKAQMYKPKNLSVPTKPELDIILND